MTSWPDDSVPEWLRHLAHDPDNYDDGRRVLEGSVYATPLIGQYLNWTAGDGTIELDGEFTAEELRLIAGMMDANEKLPAAPDS